MAKAVPLNIDKGATWIIVITVKSGAGAWDLTNYSIRMQIRESAQSDIIIAEPECTITDQTNGKIQLKLTAARTAEIPATGTGYADVAEYYYDVEMQNSSGTVWRILNGTVYVSPEVTR